EEVDVAALGELEKRLGGDGKTLLWVAADKRLAGGLALDDPLRADAPRFVSDLRRLGLDVALITGDAEAPARSAAAATGIRQVRAGLRPDEKKKVVADLRDGGRAVAVVGDGVTDAPALAAADVGIALGGGPDL